MATGEALELPIELLTRLEKQNVGLNLEFSFLLFFIIFLGEIG